MSLHLSGGLMEVRRDELAELEGVGLHRELLPGELHDLGPVARHDGP